MVDKVVTIISIQDEYLSTVSKQMTEIAGDLIKVRPISIKNLARETISEGDIVLLSANFILPLVRPFLPPGVRCIEAKRGLNFVNIKKLLFAPQGQNILVVNDTKHTTEETIQALRETVFEHNYYAYAPDTPIPEQIDYIITPGEMQIVPEGNMKVINIGYRVLALETVFEIFEALELDCQLFFLANRYMKSLVALSIGNHAHKMGSTISKWMEYKGGKTAKYFFDDIIAHSQAMNDVLKIARKLAKTGDPVHIFGETGTGKRMLAQAMHNDSSVKMGPYLNINCAARSSDMLERELFGTESGGQTFPGLFELANGGTLCIEEIDELPVSLQGRLLQVLEEGQVIRINGQTPIPIQARIISTSDTDLSLLVDEGKFRRDLFYYLAALTCKVPSLSERKEDFELLIQTYLQTHLHRGDLVIPSDMIKLLRQYSWPGNVIELFNALSYMACLDEKEITLELLPFYMKGRLQKAAVYSIPQEMDESELNELFMSIEEHGFLEESLAILEVYDEGKKQHTSYGRAMVQKRLEEKDISLSEQQLRTRLDALNQLELLNVRQGRSGTTISRKGELFLQTLRMKNKMSKA